MQEHLALFSLFIFFLFCFNLQEYVQISKHYFLLSGKYFLPFPYFFPIFCCLILINGTKCWEEILLWDLYKKIIDFSLLMCTAVQYRLWVKKAIRNVAWGIKISFWFLLSIDSCRVWVTFQRFWIGSSRATNNLTYYFTINKNQSIRN